MPSTKKLFLPHPLLLQGDPKVSKGRPESPLVASAEAKPLAKQKSKAGLSPAFHRKSVPCERFRPPAGGRGTFPHGKVPKGCRGRPKGAWNMAAPGPPVAKIQCTASLAGARPARFTSVPGRATVAFGADDPSPGSMAPVYPWSHGKKLMWQGYLATVRAAAKVPCKVRAPYGPCRSSGKGKYPYRHKGAGGATLQRNPPRQHPSRPTLFSPQKIWGFSSRKDPQTVKIFEKVSGGPPPL